MEAHANLRPDVVALGNENAQLNYRQLKDWVDGFAELFAQQNWIQPVIGIRCRDSVNQFVFSLALMKLGICQAAIHPYDTPEIQSNDIEELGVNILLQDYMPEGEDASRITLDANTLVSAIVKPLNIEKNRSSRLECAFLFLGSGTTGKPKLIGIPSNVFAAMIQNSLITCIAEEGERFFCFSKLYYFFPLRHSIVYLVKGATLVSTNRSPNDLIDFARQNQISHILLTADQALQFLFSSKTYQAAQANSAQTPLLDSVKSLTLSSSLIKQAIRDLILKTLTPNLYILYGTNDFGLISMATPKEIAKQAGTVGKLLPHVALNLQKEHVENSVGKVYVKTPMMLKGYIDNPTATQQNFTKLGFSTGDIGVLTSDKQLIIEGRSDDAMIFSGVNIYPREIEDVLELHDKIHEAAVFPMSSGLQDGIPTAVVVVTEQVSSETLQAHCEKHLGWKSPKHFFFTDKLPRNRTGKVLKRELKQQVLLEMEKTQLKSS